MEKLVEEYVIKEPAAVQVRRRVETKESCRRGRAFLRHLLVESDSNETVLLLVPFAEKNLSTFMLKVYTSLVVEENLKSEQ